jgi:hypothetical protein
MSTLVSPRPAAVLPPSDISPFGPMTGAPATTRPTYLSRSDANLVLSPPHTTFNTTGSLEKHKPMSPRQDPRRSELKGFRADLPVSTNMVSRDSAVSMQRSASKDSVTRKHPRQFVAKRKGSKIYRGPIPHHPPVRSKPQVGFNLTMTQIQSPSPRKQEPSSLQRDVPFKASNQVRPKAMSMSTQNSRPPPLQRTPSGEKGNIIADYMLM